MYKKIFLAGAMIFSFFRLNAQVDSLRLNIDLRTRAELDNGVKTLIPENKSAETTVLSRARLGLGYHYRKLEIYISAQDSRTWGETGTSAAKNQNFILNEAWAKYQFSPAMAVKLGRQVLSYDDDRLVGTLDWTMHGRSFDALKGTFTFNPNSRLEGVITYHNDDNDANDSIENEIYSIAEAGEITKSLQILHYQYSNSKKFRFSAIALNSVLQNPSGTHYDMLTAGVNAKKYFERFGLFGSAYYQTGKNTQAQSKSAYQFSLNIDFILNSNINLIAGTEWLSGKSYDTPAGENRSFSPLYGTNHNFNGFMDYFYYAGSHFNSFGINDYYIKGSFKLHDNSLLVTNLHAFTTNGRLGKNTNGEDLSSYLGSELDLVLHQRIGQYITMYLGQSFMFGSESMEVIKEVPQPKGLQSWTWIGVKVAPSFRLK